MPRPKKSTLIRVANFKGKKPDRPPDENPYAGRISGTFCIKISGKQLAFAVLVEGGSYAKISRMFNHCGVQVVGRSTFDTYQKPVADELIKMGRESMNYYKSQIQQGTVICMDGNWDHKRHGKHCLVTVIDNINWKIIDC